MTADPVKVALIDCGRIAGHHCRSIATVDGVALAAMCDLADEKARAYGEEFGVPYFTNYHTMFAEVPDIDVVAVITPSGMHLEHGLDVMPRGVEVPAADASTLGAVLDSTGKPPKIQHNDSFAPVNLDVWRQYLDVA